jgi:hypothetical protein
VINLRLSKLICALFVLAHCDDVLASPATPAAAADNPSKEARVLMTVGAHRFNVVLADNEAARAFRKQLPLTLAMEELNGNEKHAQLPKPLPAKASRPGTIRGGDLMLYGSSTLVVFYATFDSSYSYTRLGRIDDAPKLAEALGRGEARVSFSTP